MITEGIRVARDPFARHELHRRTYSGDDKMKCEWCGNIKKRMYTYECETDAGTKCGESDQFCDLNCYKENQL
jgi:hypothetical protein